MHSSFSSIHHTLFLKFCISSTAFKLFNDLLRLQITRITSYLVFNYLVIRFKLNVPGPGSITDISTFQSSLVLTQWSSIHFGARFYNKTSLLFQTSLVATQQSFIHFISVFYVYFVCSIIVISYVYFQQVGNVQCMFLVREVCVISSTCFSIFCCATCASNHCDVDISQSHQH